MSSVAAGLFQSRHDELAFHFADGLAYAGNDPKACVNCHIMRDQYNGWQISSHHNHATCNDCHVPEAGLAKWICKADNGYRHSKGFTCTAPPCLRSQFTACPTHPCA